MSIEREAGVVLVEEICRHGQLGGRISLLREEYSVLHITVPALTMISRRPADHSGQPEPVMCKTNTLTEKTYTPSELTWRQIPQPEHAASRSTTSDVAFHDD